MALGKTTTIENLESAVAALRSRHSTLNERKAEARSAFDQGRADQRRFFLEADINDNGTITRLEDALGAATLRLSSLSEACAAVEAQIADAEQKIATEAEREEREAAAKEIMATPYEPCQRSRIGPRFTMRSYGSGGTAPFHPAKWLVAL